TIDAQATGRQPGRPLGNAECRKGRRAGYSHARHDQSLLALFCNTDRWALSTARGTIVVAVAPGQWIRNHQGSKTLRVQRDCICIILIVMLGALVSWWFPGKVRRAERRSPRARAGTAGTGGDGYLAGAGFDAVDGNALEDELQVI